MSREGTGPDGRDSMAISEVADHFGISQRSLRFYEEIGMISPSMETGARYYDQADMRRIEVITSGKRLGFSMNEIARHLRRGGKPSTFPATSDADAIRECLGRLVEKRREVDAALEELTVAFEEAVGPEG